MPLGFNGGLMDGLNRMVTFLVALLAVVAVIVVLLVTTESLDPDFLPGGSAQTPSDAWFYAQLKGLADFGGGDQTITIVVTVAVAIVMLGVLVMTAAPGMRRRHGSLQISSTAEGLTSVEVSSVRLLAERTGAVNRSVISISCRIGVRRRPAGSGPASILIACYPRVVLGSDLQEIRDDLQTRIKQTVEKLIGLTVLQVHVVRIKFDKGEDSRLLAA